MGQNTMVDINPSLVSPDAPLITAIKAINKGKIQIALVVDEKNHLLGTLTDGDIRRALLNDLDVGSPVSMAMNKNPMTARTSDDRRQIETMMRRHVIRQVPILNDQGMVVDVHVLGKHHMVSHRDNPVVLMAGGLGSRLSPLTDYKPKPLLAVGGKPILETILESLVAQGFWQFFITVRYKSDMIQEHFGDGSKWNVDIRYINEDEPKGTAGSLALLPDSINQPTLVMNGDILCQLDTDLLFCHHTDGGYDMTVGVCRYQTTVPFGCVETDNGQLTALQEKPVTEHLINAGIYVLSPQAIRRVPTDKEYQITDLIDSFLGSDGRVGAFTIESYWRDVGNHVELARANQEFYDAIDKG